MKWKLTRVSLILHDKWIRIRSSINFIINQFNLLINKKSISYTRIFLAFAARPYPPHASKSLFLFFERKSIYFALIPLFSSFCCPSGSKSSFIFKWWINPFRGPRPCPGPRKSLLMYLNFFDYQSNSNLSLTLHKALEIQTKSVTPLLPFVSLTTKSWQFLISFILIRCLLPFLLHTQAPSLPFR